MRLQNMLSILAGIAVLLAVAAATFLLLKNAPAASGGSVYSAQFTQYSKAATVFRSRMTDFDGVCAELLLTAGASCTDAVETYRVFTRLKEGGYYCTDASGFMGSVATLGSNNSCL